MKISPLILIKTLLLIALLQYISPPTYADFIADDGFTDGGRTSGTDALDCNWFTISNPTVAVVDDSAGIGFGNGLKITPTATYQGVVANLPSSVTLADGDSVTLSFDWRFTGTTNLNQSARFRFGIYNSGGTLTASDNNATIRLNDVGYLGATNPGVVSGTATTIGRETTGDEILSGTNFITLGSGGASINSGTIAHYGVMTIVRSGTTLGINVSIDGQPPATATDSAPVTYTFDEVGFHLGSTSIPSPLILDNVQLVRSIMFHGVNDSFTDGGRTDGTDPLDIAWHYTGAPFWLGVVNDSTGIGSGNALELQPSGSWQGMLGNAPWFHLGNGDSLTLSFDYRFTGSSNQNEANKLRFGILNDGGTTATADGMYNIGADDYGYLFATNPGLASGTGSVVYRSGTNPMASIAGASISSGTTKHTVTMTLQRSGTTMTCFSNVDGQPGASGTDTMPYYAFNEISTFLAGTTATSPYRIDNVKLDYSQETQPVAEGPPAGNWNLVLAEEFSGTNFNTSVWSRGFRWAGPMQADISAMRPENVTVANGVCTIKVEKRTAQDMDMYGYQGTTLNYCSGALTTYSKWAQTYGYFEARLKMPAGKGTWPAFWIMPDRGSQYDDYYRTTVGSTVYYPDGHTTPCPMGNEIDIFEHMGSWKNLTSGTSRLHSGYIWAYGSGASSEYVHQTGLLGTQILGNPDGQYHNYGLYWAPGQLIYYIDGKVSMRRDYQTKVSVVPEYVILNCAVSTDDWTGTPVTTADIDAGLPSYMVIDYVRVYSGTPNPAP